MSYKVAIVTDTHWGIRGSSHAFANNQSKFWTFFWERIDKDGIDTILHGGDVYDKRKSIDFLTFQNSQRDFFDKAEERGIKVYMIVGNHCVYYKNTNTVNSLDLLLKQYPNVEVISDSPRTIQLDGIDLDMVPWFHNELHNPTLEFITKSKSTAMLGHLELSGFQMNKGITSKHGLAQSLFSKYMLVMSGHYHTKSTKGNVTYLGATSEYTWADCNDARGFHYYYPHTYELEHIKNPYTMFEKVYVYQTTQEKDLPEIEGKFIRLIQDYECSSEHFDKILISVKEALPEDLDVIELSQVAILDTVSNEDLEKTYDTNDFILEAIEDVDTKNIDKVSVTGFMKTLYLEAVNK